MKYKCIIFDCDGVLVDSEEISNNTLVSMTNALGASIDMRYAESNFTGKSLNSVLDHIENIVEKNLPSDFEEEFRKKTFQAFRNDIKPIKGISQVLDKISAPYCVASSGPREKIILNLTVTNLIHQFEDNIFSCYDIGRWKPDPAIFLHAAKNMGHPPSECVVIEDSMSGIKAARSGGFDVFAYSNKNNYKEFINAGANVFFDMNNLIKLLNSQ